MKKTTLTAFLLILSVFISVAALGCGDDSSEITDFVGAGLAPFMNDEITGMYVDQTANPNLKGDFFDEEVLSELRELVSTATFQETDKPKRGNEPGSHVAPYFKFTSDESEYVFMIDGDTLCVQINGESKYYNSSIRAKVERLISDVIEKEFSEE